MGELDSTETTSEQTEGESRLKPDADGESAALVLRILNSKSEVEDATATEVGSTEPEFN